MAGLSAAILIAGGIAFESRSENLSPISLQRTKVGEFFSRDDKHVYDTWGKVVQGADPKTFKLCEPRDFSGCAIDGTNTIYVDIYGDGSISRLPADFGSFKMLNLSYAVDRNNVFSLYAGEEGPPPHIIAGADARSFVSWQHMMWYAKDNNRVYVGGLTVTPPVDPATVSVLDRRYLKDSKHVYLVPTPHWRLAGPWIGDKVAIISQADPNTFTLLQSSAGNVVYAKDAYRVYYGDQTVVGADHDSFRAVGARPRYDAEDRYRKYLNGQAATITE